MVRLKPDTTYAQYAAPYAKDVAPYAKDVAPYAPVRGVRL